MKLHGEDRKQQIIEQATKLFASEGYDKVTTKKLAAACGVTEPALYRYFDSKELIYDSVLDALEEKLKCESLYSELEKVEDVEELLARIGGHLLSCAESNHDICRLLLYSALGGHTKAKGVYQAIRGRYAGFLQTQLDRLAAKGKIAKSNSEITARSFVGMIFDCAMGISVWKSTQGKHYRCDEIVANNIPIFARGLMPGSPQK